MVDLSRLSDAELLSGCREATPLFKTASERTEAYLTELKRRFCIARSLCTNIREPFFFGYTSWNKFVVGELSLSLTTVRRMTPSIKLQDHTFDWRLSEFGEGCYKKHEYIGEGLLKSVASKFDDVQWGGWAPWRPTMDSQTKAGYRPVEDRYKVTLFLTAEQVRGLNAQ
jgi:hypothetical protein